MTTIAVITTYNEAGTIGPLVFSLRQLVTEVIVEDGGSSDGTFEEAATYGAITASTHKRRPIAQCLTTGWGEALKLGADRILQIDAGGSHRVTDAQPLLASDADLVIGSRFVKGSRYEGNPKRQMMSRIAGMACNVALPGAVWKDWTSGYRVFSREAAEYLVDQEYRGRQHEWQIEVLAKAIDAGFTVEEVPITYIAGRSSFNTRTMKRCLDMLMRVYEEHHPLGRSHASKFFVHGLRKRFLA